MDIDQLRILDSSATHGLQTLLAGTASEQLRRLHENSLSRQMELLRPSWVEKEHRRMSPFGAYPIQHSIMDGIHNEVLKMREEHRRMSCAGIAGVIRPDDRQIGIAGAALPPELDRNGVLRMHERACHVSELFPSGADRV